MAKKKKMSAKQAKYFAKKGTKKKPVLGVDYGLGTKMFGPQRKRGRKAKISFAEGSYSAISDRAVYVHKKPLTYYKGKGGKRKLKHAGKGRKKANFKVTSRSDWGPNGIKLSGLIKRRNRLNKIIASRSS